jgi:hypothetical protein
MMSQLVALLIVSHSFVSLSGRGTGRRIACNSLSLALDAYWVMTGMTSGNTEEFGLGERNFTILTTVKPHRIVI